MVAAAWAAVQPRCDREWARNDAGGEVDLLRLGLGRDVDAWLGEAAQEAPRSV